MGSKVCTGSSDPDHPVWIRFGQGYIAIIGDVFRHETASQDAILDKSFILRLPFLR